MRRGLRGLLYVAEWWLRLPWPPPLRVWWLRRFAADVARTARVHRCHFINLEVAGFAHLHIGEQAHVGPETLIDLADAVHIADRVSLAPRVIVLTHADAGAGVLAQDYPRIVERAVIGADSWIGAGAIILAGARIGERCVVGAGAVVTESVSDDERVAGVPARPIHR